MITCGVLSRLPGRRPVALDQAHGIGEAGAGRPHEGVGELSRAPHRRGHAAADPDRRARLLVRARPDLHVLEGVVLAVKRKRLAGEAPAQDLHALLEERHAVLHGNAVGAEVRRLIADAHAEDDAPLRHEVERDRVLGHAHGMVERQQDDRGPDAQGLGARRHRRGHDERRGQEAVLVLVMLAEEAGVEAARLGELRLGDDLVDRAVQVLAARRIGDRAVDAELHGALRPLSRA